MYFGGRVDVRVDLRRAILYRQQPEAVKPLAKLEPPSE